MGFQDEVQVLSVVVEGFRVHGDSGIPMIFGPTNRHTRSPCASMPWLLRASSMSRHTKPEAQIYGSTLRRRRLALSASSTGWQASSKEGLGASSSGSPPPAREILSFTALHSHHTEIQSGAITGPII